MKIYLIEIEQHDGDKYDLPATPFKTEELARKYLEHFRTDLYRHINIKAVDIPDQDLLFEFVCFIMHLHHSPKYDIDFKDFYTKVGKIEIIPIK